MLFLVFVACQTVGHRSDQGEESIASTIERDGHEAPELVDPERPFANPWIDAGDLPGPIPLFESLNDDSGRRYVVGEGAFLAAEDGIVQSFPAVLTMTPVHPDLVLDREAIPADLVPLVRSASEKIAPDLAMTIAAAEAENIDILALIFLRDGETGIQTELERAMASGTVRSLTDYEQERDVLIAEQEQRIAERVALVTDAIETNDDGSVIAHGRGLAWILATLPARSFENLANRADVWSIDDATRQGVSLGVADGEVHQDGAQLRQYVSAGFTGAGASLPGTGDNIIAAIVELNEDGFTFNTTHPAWKDTDGTTLRFATGPGVTGKWDCNAVPCSPTAAFVEPPGSHATNIAGIIFGDLTNTPPQDPSVALADRDRASGFAREAKVHMYDVAPSQANVVAALDHLSNLDSDEDFPHVVSNSYRFPEIGFACQGNTPISLAANRAYISGVAVFSGAGNESGSSTSCLVGTPGAAIGSFTVGAHLSSASGVDALAIRNGAIFTLLGGVGSAWGGNLTEGDNRSIVSMTAAGPRTARIMADGTVNFGTAVTGMTSYATAVVAAAAVDVMDHHMRGSTWIDSPGQLYATLLLMGDRQGASAYRTFSPDHRWGVGRLRARKLNSGGMDAPYYWYHGATCIGQGEAWDLNLSGGDMPDDIEAVKAAAYWYDYRHETNVGAVQVANVDISLRNSTSSLVADNDVWDNKAVVFRSSWGTEPVILRISGTSGISGHNHPACGANQVYVHFAIFAEDSDREAPTYTAGTGIGVAPEHLEF